MQSHKDVSYNTSINSIEFALANSEQNKDKSYVEIYTHKQYENDLPIAGGLYDANMGPIYRNYNCETCKHNKEACPGHNGNLKLNYPVINVLFVSDIRKWLKIVCHTCGNLILSLENINKKPYLKTLPKNNKLTELIKLKISKNTAEIKCDVCGSYQPQVYASKKIEKKEHKFIYTAKLYIAAGTGIKRDKETKLVNEYLLYPHNFLEIFSRLPNEYLHALDIDLMLHPKNYILTDIVIPPPMIRPKTILPDGKQAANYITSSIDTIIKTNIKIPKQFNLEDPMQLTNIKNLNLLYQEYIEKPTLENEAQTGNITSLIGGLKTKKGIIRGKLCGKIVSMIFRGVIVCNSKLKLDEIEIPRKFAKKLLFREKCTPYNIEKLQKLFVNQKKYPGCPMIEKHNLGAKYENDGTYSLEIDDIVYRHILDGDVIQFCRQPSLYITSIMGMKMIVNKAKIDKKGIGVNVISCTFFNADFDGDQMNGYFVVDPLSINELLQIASVPNNFIWFERSSPYVGLAQDSVIGCALFTRHSTRISRYNAMKLFSETTIIPNLTKNIYTGREIVEMVIPPITYEKDSAFGMLRNVFPKDLLDRYSVYDESDLKIVIKNGKYLSGILDGGAIKDSMGSIFHVIAKEYGNIKAVECIYNLQRIVAMYLKTEGFTINIRDFYIGENTKQKKHLIEDQLMLNSAEIINRLNNNSLIPPVGQTLSQYVEEEQKGRLEYGDKLLGPVLESNDPQENNLLRLLLHGSKGKWADFYNMVMAIGQANTDQKRLPENLSYKRSTIWTNRCSDDPKSRGFVSNSLISGIDILEAYSLAYKSRYDILTKGLVTAEAGQKGRDSRNNLESLIVDNRDFVSKNNGTSIVQLLFGDDGIDPRFAEKTKIITAKISNEELEKKFHFTKESKFYKPEYNKIQKLFDEQFKKIKDDRDLYREIFMAREGYSYTYFLLDDYKLLPFNIKRIIDSSINKFNDVSSTSTKTLNESSSFGVVGRNNISPASTSVGRNKQPSTLELEKMIHIVNDFCELLPKLRFNENYIKNNKKIPYFITKSCFICQMTIRAYLNPEQLAQLSKELLEVIFHITKITLLKSYIDAGTNVGTLSAQSLTAPLTQYLIDAHHASAGGGTKRDGVRDYESITKIKLINKASSPTMFIRLLPEFENDQATVKKIANKLEMLKFKNFILNAQILYETIGQFIAFPSDKTFYQNFIKYNPINKPKTNLIKGYFRFILNKEVLIYKSISIEDIVLKLENYLENVYIMYSSDNDKELIIHVYFTTRYFKEKILSEKILKDTFTDVENILISGIKGITGTKVEELKKSEIQPDGSIKTTEGKYFITTKGINMRDIIRIPEIDLNKVFCNNIIEMYELFGIEAARERIIVEMRTILQELNIVNCNYVIYGDYMTFTGIPSGISEKGQKIRETNNILLRMYAKNPTKALVDGITRHVKNNINGITAPIMLGQLPKTGTTYSQLLINEEFVKNNYVSKEDILDEII